MREEYAQRHEELLQTRPTPQGAVVIQWKTSQLTDFELRKGIAQYRSALEQLADDALGRLDIAARLEVYEAELTGRLRARRVPLPTAVSRAYPDDASLS
jgi:hypothetical protein